jgi:iron(III) transport system ATP-binding protein
MIRINDLSVAFEGGPQSHLAVDDVSLEVRSGHFYTLLGPSGCGKTTTLRCVAGLHRPKVGRISVGLRTVFDAKSGVFVPPHDRLIGMVFQSYAIWPHMNVFENVAFPLRRVRPRLSKTEVHRRVLDSLALVKLEGLHERAATDLSGGQQQRLALARALVGEPQVLLLDEPLSNLDAKLREEMRQELKALTRRLQVTTLFVTHEQVEALTMSDQIAVMKAGRIVQQGSPSEIYRSPRDRFVADFVGRTNLLSGRILDSEQDGTGYRTAVETDIGLITCHSAERLGNGGVVTIAVRPENIVPMEDDAETSRVNTVAGKVEQVSYIGNLTECAVSVGNQLLKVQLHPDLSPQLGADVRLRVDPGNFQILAG